MTRLLETIMVSAGAVRNWQYHNARINRTRRDLFGSTDELDIRTITPPTNGHTGPVRCRVIYAGDILSVSTEAYIRQPIRSLRLLRRDDISYPYKFEERTQFAEALQHRGNCDEILIVKHGRITDTSFSNVAFFNDRAWVTPAEPLLKGTMRQSLLDRGMIVEEDLRISDLKHFSQIMLISALWDFNLRTTLMMSDLSAVGFSLH
ncbi:MAG: aminotransferase class IV [Acidobacteriota bacterium]